MPSKVDKLISLAATAELLGISPKTLYRWCQAARRGALVLNGHRVHLTYYQSGALGQGRIMFDRASIDHLKSAMQIVPGAARPPPQHLRRFTHISAVPGRPKG